MKEYILLICLVFLVPAAFAVPLEIDDIRGYVNDERETNIDEDGGNFDVMPNDILEIVIRLKNNENVTVEARVEGILENIDDGDDIVKELDFYDIDAEDDRARTLSFSIPGDARRDDYILDLKIDYKFNGSTDDLDTIEFDVFVETTSTSTSTTTDLDHAISNLTTSCNRIADTADICFNFIGKSNNCSSELSTVKEQRGEFKSKSDELQAKVDSLQGDNAELTRQITQLENQALGMIPRVQCNNMTATAVRSAQNQSSSSSTQNLLLLAGAGFAIWQYNKRRKAKASVATAYQSDYYDK